MQRKKKLAAELPKARQTVEELKAGRRKAVAQLPDTKEIPGLLSSISGVGRQSGLEIFQFRQLPSVVKDFYAEVPVQVTVRGGYFQLAEFFKRVGEMTRIVNVRNIAIKAPSNVATDPVQVETSCATTTFRFLTEEERAAIERAKKKKKGRR